MLGLLSVLLALPASAHPAPFTFLDVRVQRDRLELSLVAHVFDVAHDTGLQTPEQLFEPAVLEQRGPQFAALLPERIRFVVDGRSVATSRWSVVEPLPDRQSIRLEATAPLDAAPGVIGLTAYLFPYDTAHQTFVNFHDGDTIASQTILDAARRDTRFYAGTLAGGLAAARRVLLGSARHTAFGLEHLAIAIGLLLLATSPRQLGQLVIAFIAGQLLTMVLGGFAFVLPPQRLLEPALALAIVYAGADSIMASGGRDVRPWMAGAMGGIHGFSLAAQLRTLGFSRLALGWSIAATQVGVGVTLLLLMWVVRRLFEGVRARGPRAASRLVLAGSALVIVTGVAWFAQLVFLPASLLPAFLPRL